jgi:hypothetical protein
MKKVLFLLLLTSASYGQAIFDKGIKITGGQSTTTNTNKLISQEANGVLNQVNAINLPLSTAAITEFKTKSNLSTGLLRNGLITIDVDPTKYSITAGVGVVSNFSDPLNITTTIVNFPAINGRTPSYLTSSNITYIAVNASGIIVESALPFTATENRSLIILGAAIHSNKVNINLINNISSPSNDVKNQLNDFMNAVGALNESGNKYTANGANLSLDKTAGTIFKNGSNFANDNTNPHQLSQSQLTALTFRYRTQNGTEGADRTVLDPSVYDLNNVLTSVPTNRFTITTVDMFQSGTSRLQYGQNTYSTLDEAEKAINTRSFIVESNIALQAIARAFIIMRHNTTDLTNPTTSKIIESQKFGGITSGGTAVTNEQILTALGFTPENTADKQNSLAIDGSGVKFPTVDAVNGGLALKANTASPTFTGTVSGITKSMVGLSNVDNTSDVNKPVSTAQATALNLKEDKSAKGAASGYASLDGSGKVPLTQINDVLLGSVNYKGTYNASTNVPALPVASSSNKGFYYVVSVSGTQQSLTLKGGDWVISNGTEWGKVDNNNAVTSVNAKVGAVTLTTADISDVIDKRYQTDLQQSSNDATSSIQTQLNGKEASIGVKGTAFNKDFGTVTGTVGDGGLVATNTAKVSNATHTGDVTGATALSIASGVVTNAKLANMVTKTYKGRTSAATGVPEDVSVASLKSDLSLNNVPNTDFTSAVAANTAKVSFDSTSSTRLANTSGTNTGDQTLSSLGAAPSSGSANYIQNGTAQQTANLNISGSGTFGSSVVSGGDGSFNVKRASDNLTVVSLSINSTTSIAKLNTAYSFLTFLTEGVERARFSTGNLLIGTTVDNGSKLQVDGAATFASSVTATNGIFSGNVGIGRTSATELIHLESNLPVIRFTKTGLLSWKIGNIANNDFYINSDAGGGNALVLNASNGAATFSSSVTANKLFSQNSLADGNGAELKLIGGATNAQWSIGTNVSAITGEADGLYFYKNSGTVGQKLKILDNGAATFASSVTATDVNSRINFTADVWHTSSDGVQRFTFVPNSDSYFKSGNNWIFRNSSDVNVATLTSTGAATFSSSVKATNFSGDAFPSNSNLGSSTDATTTKVYSGSTAGSVTSMELFGGGAANPNTISFKTASVERLSIAPTGAATFSSSVTANGNSVINGLPGGDVLTLNKASGASLALSGSTGTTNNILLLGSNSTNPDLQIFVGGSVRQTIAATTGAATFSSSVTATSHVTTGGSATQLVKGNGALTVGYKVYTALISQSGTAIPTVTILENTLGFTPTFTRSNVGLYTMLSSGAFIASKTTSQIQGVGLNNATIYRGSDSVLFITTTLSNGSYSDDAISVPTLLEVRIYN